MDVINALVYRPVVLSCLKDDDTSAKKKYEGLVSLEVLNLEVCGVQVKRLIFFARKRGRDKNEQN